MDSLWKYVKFNNTISHNVYKRVNEGFSKRKYASVRIRVECMKENGFSSTYTHVLKSFMCFIVKLCGFCYIWCAEYTGLYFRQGKYTHIYIDKWIRKLIKK